MIDGIKNDIAALKDRVAAGEVVIKAKTAWKDYYYTVKVNVQ